MNGQTLLFFICGLTSCSSTSFDRDQRNPIYHNGGNTILTPLLPTPGTSERRLATPEELAIGGVLATGVTLAMNKDYYKSSSIRGRCRCVASNEPSFEIPCGTVTVVLEGNQGTEISRVTSDDGEFVFPVEKDKSYQLRAYSRFYVGHYKEFSSLRMGDSVVLQLSEKVAKTGE